MSSWNKLVSKRHSLESRSQYIYEQTKIRNVRIQLHLSQAFDLSVNNSLVSLRSTLDCFWGDSCTHPITMGCYSFDVRITKEPGAEAASRNLVVHSMWIDLW